MSFKFKLILLALAVSALVGLIGYTIHAIATISRLETLNHVKKPIEKLNRQPEKASHKWMLATILVASGIGLTGCVNAAPVNKPCGVITDPLGDVHATTKEGTRRLDIHFERGVKAGCWDRSTAVRR